MHMGKAHGGMRNTFLPMREAAATLGERKWHQNARKASKSIIDCKRMSYLCCADGKTEASEQPAQLLMKGEYQGFTSFV